jgi:hypothetical protein
MPSHDPIDPWRIGLALAGVMNLANAAWMLIDPAHWYATLPAAVPDTGPLNPHFVRDVGSAFGVFGAALLLAAARPALRAPLVGLTALFYVLHALVHVADTLSGRLPWAHWRIDFPGVYLPALVLVACRLALARRPPTSRPA